LENPKKKKKKKKKKKRKKEIKMLEVPTTNPIEEK
jgi:hypothetical protein